MRFLSIVAVSLIGASLIGCSSKRVYPLVEKSLPATPADQDVRLYVNALERPLVELAYIDSTAYPERDPETVQKQLKELTDKARKMGADAVMSVEVLDEKIRGMVIDEAVPFRAYRQGNFELYFIRGTAVKYFDTEEEALEFAGPDSLFAKKLEAQKKKNSNGPRYIRDREAEQPMDSIPRGLGRKNI